MSMAVCKAIIQAPRSCLSFVICNQIDHHYCRSYYCARNPTVYTAYQIQASGFALMFSEALVSPAGPPGGQVVIGIIWMVVLPCIAPVSG